MRRTLAAIPLCVLLAGCGGWGFSVASNKDMRTLLEKAAQAGDLDEVRRLLASGANPNDHAGLFSSPLYSATLRNHNAEVIGALVRAGADPNGRDEEDNACRVVSATGFRSSLAQAGAAISRAPSTTRSRSATGW